MSVRENAAQALLRWRKLELVQAAYPDFIPFLQDMMEELGFHTDDVQEDIAKFLESGPQYLMIQAQRGQAKTTVSAIYVVWCILHNPRLRVLILSAGETQASEISTLIIRLILTVDILEPMRPDPNNGDRTSVDHFDTHYSLKGIDKSPTVACVGINGNLQGKRADLLLADDVESNKNSRTAVMREQLLNVTRDFTSICSIGRIVYLGTPQSVESIYNTLPGRGFAVRIWPGRYPNKTQLEAYGDSLAPFVRDRLLADVSLSSGYGADGEQGKATSPRIISEDTLVAKELDQGPAYFQLQHMLLTALTDALRYPLKVENVHVLRMLDGTYPLTITRAVSRANREFSINTKRYRLSDPAAVSVERSTLPTSVLYIDPAGGGLNADESGWAYGGHLNSNIYVPAIGGVPGGYEAGQLEAFADLVLKWRPTLVVIEKNFGFGAFRAVLTPVVTAACQRAGVPVPGFQDDMVTGQKELRIIEILEPVIGRGSLIFNEAIMEQEPASLARYDLRVRDTYSVLFQLSKLTRDKNSLVHDDRLDALAGLVRFFSSALVKDQKKVLQAAMERDYSALLANPLGLPSRALTSQRTSQSMTSTTNRLRKF